MRRLLPAATALAALLLASPALARPLTFELRSLDGRGNNRAHPDWGRAGTPYQRVAPAAYADGASVPADGPNPRYVSNRVFNDLGQNLFSERGVTQWVWTWGQFMDHTFGLARGGGAKAPIGFRATDPIETFRNDLGAMSFQRDAAAPGTGAGTPREQLNTVSSFIDGWSVYGGTRSRLEWLRAGPVDGDMRNNSARLLTARGGLLPKATARGDAKKAPPMEVDGMLRTRPQDAVVTGDVRANENMALTAVHTLFVREHNRIVRRLPKSLSEERKFQIARRVVSAEQQYVTYDEFLPAVGVVLEPYRGYDRNVNPSLGNEFATVAYRAHSMIHGEFEIEVNGRERVVTLNEAFFNPDLVAQIGVGPVLASLSGEPQYKNDEQIDNSLRSVLFQFPGPGATDPVACFSDPAAAGCFRSVVDLGALDIARGRDHGMPTYNDMRRAFGLRPVTSFTEITDESTDRFAANRGFDAATAIDNPRSLEFSELRDERGRVLPAGSAAAEDGARSGVRQTTLAARLRAIYGSVDNLDAFVGMVSERHVPGSEFGPLQRAVWKRQFEALRDGDRFYYERDRVLPAIQKRYGITYRHTLAQLIRANTDADDVPANVFFAPPETDDD